MVDPSDSTVLKHRSLSLTRIYMYVYVCLCVFDKNDTFNMHIARAWNEVSSSRLQEAIGSFEPV